jgi:hypothetical protein
MSDNQRLFKCPKCGLHYKNKEIVKKCEAWCDDYKSCNLEITRLSQEVKSRQPKE